MSLIYRLSSKKDISDTVYEYNSVMGLILMKTDKGKSSIASLKFASSDYKDYKKDYVIKDSNEVDIKEPEVVLSMKREIDEYLLRKIKSFSTKISLSVPDFTYNVLSIVYNIPYGEITTYSAIAHSMGRRGNTSRAVGNALSRNPIALIIPCHRVVAKYGELRGFAYGLWRKEELLELENPSFQSTLL
jgi:methylated-DNA-[protein]-cysteine S-methyltransferase